jgi:hypothetical protein
MKNLISFVVIVFLLAACMKMANKRVTITGRLMHSCGIPAANTTLLLIEYDYSHKLISNEVWEEFTTNDNGYFSVRVRNNAKLRLNLKEQMKRIVSGIEVGETKLDLGEIYCKEFETNFIIKLDVLNQYTAQDTLIIEDYNEIGGTSFLANKKVKYYPGPFSSGELEVVQNYLHRSFPISHASYVDFNAPEFSVRYRIRTASGEESNNFARFRLSPICSDEFAEVTLVIE